LELAVFAAGAWPGVAARETAGMANAAAPAHAKDTANDNSAVDAAVNGALFAIVSLFSPSIGSDAKAPDCTLRPWLHSRTQSF